MKSTQTLQLGQLKLLVDSLSHVQCDFFAEACTIAFENQGHQSGVVLKVEGDFQTSYQIDWKMVSKKSGWQEPRKIAENGSIAIAFLLILELTEYKVIQQAIIGTGFDYWLGYKETNELYEPDNFLNARLEISGMNHGNRTEIAQRVKQKLRQTGKSDYLKIPAFVIVTEFGVPISIIIKK